MPLASDSLSFEFPSAGVSGNRVQKLQWLCGFSRIYEPGGFGADYNLAPRLEWWGPGCARPFDAAGLRTTAADRSPADAWRETGQLPSDHRASARSLDSPGGRQNRVVSRQGSVLLALGQGNATGVG